MKSENLNKKYDLKNKKGTIYNRKNKTLKIDVYDYDVFPPKTVKMDGVEVLVLQEKLIYAYNNKIYQSWVHLGTEPIKNKYNEPIYNSDRFILTPDEHTFCLDDMVEIADVV